MASAQSERMAEESSRGAACRRNLPWEEEFRALLNRHLRGATRRLAADGHRYTWWEFALYYREHANAMWVAARERGNAVWLREHIRRIRWRIFARKMNRFARACWRYAYRQIVDKRIGARRMPPNDWPDVRGLDVSDLAQLDSAEPGLGKRRLDCERRGQMLEEHATLAVFEDVPCIVYNGGVVLGFQLRVSNLHCMRDLSEPFVSAWTRMHELGILGGPADTDTRHPCRAGARQGRREAADPRP